MLKLKHVPYVGHRLDAAIRKVRLQGYRPGMFDAEEEQRWRESSLDFERARERLASVLMRLDEPPFDSERHSIHWVLAACIEQRLAPKRILELGTFRGQFTAILAELYPDAEVFTVDLPDWDPLVLRMYKRQKPDVLERERAAREHNLNRSNVTRVEANSFFLLDAIAGPFDAIWVDAGHKFPDVAWDICNAFHLARPGGIVMLDDVTTDPAFATKNLGPDSEIVLRYVAERTNVRMHYFLKRRNAVAFLHPTRRKNVVWCEKPTIWPGGKP
jgi:predicted O-methyltransferase YrrM